ncbi:MAG TPA: hypothetical protein VK150_02020 [Geothrix sp.]|nr:hypothetical protein [Geothrix sp.]
MSDYAVANGLACYDCGYTRCRCEDIEAEAWAEELARSRAALRTDRLLLAIELMETKIARIEDETKYHPALPELRERLENLTLALLNHRRAHHKELF